MRYGYDRQSKVIEFVKSIIEDVKWLGYKWNDDPLFASDYFDQMHDYALKLIENRIKNKDIFKDLKFFLNQNFSSKLRKNYAN